MSASDVLRGLIKRDVKSPESRRALHGFLHSPCYGYFLKTLESQDVLGYVNFLDKALSWIPTTEELWTSCLNALRQVSRDRTILPATHVLCGRIKRRNASMTNRDAEKYSEAQYKGRAVQVRTLRVSPDLSQVVKRFCDDAVLWRRLNHPNIASVLGVTMDPCQVIFDKVTNENIIQYGLSNVVDRGSLVSDIAEGLEYLHNQNVVHGRLRGAAISLNDQGFAVLADFGSCSVVWNHEDTLQVIRWCAPEVLGSEKASGTRPTFASDVFSFGMVVLEIFSGKPPFDGVPDDEVAKWVRSGERPNRPGGTANHGLSDTLWDVIQGCWDESPEFRPQMADVLDCTRNIQLMFAAEYSETSTFIDQPSMLKMNGWKGFLSPACGFRTAHQ